MILALSTWQIAAWWATLGAGLVVALVVWFLLEQVRRTVRAIDTGVGAVWTSGKLVAQNTQAAHLLQTTKARGVDLLDELERHAALAERSKR